MLRQSIFALLCFASVGLIAVSYERARALGAIVAVVVAITGLFSLRTSVTDIITLAVIFPVYVGTAICLMLLAVWFCGPGSALWKKVFSACSVTVRRSIIGLILFGVIAAGAWSTIVPPDYAGIAYAKLEQEVVRKAAAAAQPSSDVLAPVISVSKQQADKISSAAILLLGAGAKPIRANALGRLDQMQLEQARATAARAGVERITNGSLDTREGAMRDLAEKSANEAATKIRETNRDKIQTAMRAAVEETQREQLKAARETLAGAPPEKLDELSKSLVSKIAQRLRAAGDAAVATAARDVLAAAPEQILDATRDAVRPILKAAIDDMQAQINSLFDELTAALREAERLAKVEEAKRLEEEKKKQTALVPPPPPPTAAPVRTTRRPVPNKSALDGLPAGIATRDYLLSLMRENTNRCAPGHGQEEEALMNYLFDGVLANRHDRNVLRVSSDAGLNSSLQLDTYFGKPAWTRKERAEVLDIIVRIYQENFVAPSTINATRAAFSRFYERGGCPFDTVSEADYVLPAYSEMPTDNLQDIDSCLAGAMGAPASGFKLQCNKALVGGNTLGSIENVYSVGNIGECAAYCRPVPGCIAFSYSGRGAGRYHACYLYGKTPTPFPSVGWISGSR
jgi:hypothetical protein